MTETEIYQHRDRWKHRHKSDQVHSMPLDKLVLRIPLCGNCQGQGFVGNTEHITPWCTQLSLVQVDFIPTWRQCQHQSTTSVNSVNTSLLICKQCQHQSTTSGNSVNTSQLHLETINTSQLHMETLSTPVNYIWRHCQHQSTTSGNSVNTSQLHLETVSTPVNYIWRHCQHQSTTSVNSVNTSLLHL